MVTKVGRQLTQLICSDCGHPRNELRLQGQSRQIAWAYLLLFCLVFTGSALTIVRSSGGGAAPELTGSPQQQK